MNLLWLGDPKSFDSTLVGGKAANLSRLARMDHRVPDGFSLPVTAMDKVHPLNLRDEINCAISDLMACLRLSEFIAAVRSSAVDEDGALSPFLQRLFNSYSQAFNLQQYRTGTLFEARAKSILVEESKYVYALVRYIHLNPVVARLVSKPEEWQFSNYLEWIGVRSDVLFDPPFSKLFFASPEEYRKFVNSDIPEAMERKLAKYYFD